MFDGPSPARSSASSTEFVVSTPKVIGTPVAAAGTRVNPLEHLPFTQRLIVFDARDPDPPRDDEAHRALGSVACRQRLGLVAREEQETTYRRGRIRAFPGGRQHLSTAPALIDASTPQEGLQYALSPLGCEALLGVRVVLEDITLLMGVLDLSWLVAGPTVGRVLADFGATVVRVET